MATFTWEGALPGEEDMLTASFSSLIMLPLTGPECGRMQGSDRESMCYVGLFIILKTIVNSSE